MKMPSALLVTVILVIIFSGCITPEGRIDEPGLDFRVHGLGDLLEEGDDVFEDGYEPIFPEIGDSIVSPK